MAHDATPRLRRMGYVLQHARGLKPVPQGVRRSVPNRRSSGHAVVPCNGEHPHHEMRLAAKIQMNDRPIFAAGPAMGNIRETETK